MSIQDIYQKINTYIDTRQLFWITSIFGLTFLLIGSVGLALRSNKAEGVVITTFEAPVFNENKKSDLVIGNSDTVYASRSGKKYYYSDCPGISRIKQENRIAFTTTILAEQAGYTKAANCH
jgi:hypothetical protein